MWVRKRFEEEEYWPILNDTDAIVGYESKNSVYSLTKTVNPLEKNLHPVIRILVIADNKLLLKKNNTDDFYYPDKWDLSISGHLQYGETYKEGINRLLLKSYKLQIKDHNVHYLMKYTYENQYECQRVFLHYLPVTNSHLQQMDLKNTKLWTSIQIMGDLNSNIFTDKLKKEMILLKELSFPYIF